MKRYPHFLSQCTGDCHPGRIVGLAVESTAERIAGEEVVARERLIRWCAAGWARTSKSDNVYWEREGVTPESAWDAITYALKRGGQTWVVSACACRTWGLLGLWDMLEEGSVQLDRHKQLGGKDRGRTGPVSGLQGTGDCVGSEQEQGGSAGVRELLQGQGAERLCDRSSGGCDWDGAASPVLEDPPTVLRIRRAGMPGTIIVVDTRNWGIDPPFPRMEAPLEARWARDTLMRLDGLLRSQHWGSLCCSSGAQAWRMWRHAYADQPCYVHRNAVALELEGVSYYGGRCEARRIGPVEGPVYHLDFRSMYTSICARSGVPCLLGKVATATRPDDLISGQRGVHCIAEVMVSTAEPAYPKRTDNGIIYPVGRFWTTLAGPELADAAGRDRVLRIGRVAYYAMRPALQDFAQAVLAQLAQAREEGDRELEQALKRLGVSLVGRLGQRGYDWKPAKPSCTEPLWGEWWRLNADGQLVKRRAVAGYVWEEERSDWAPESCPAIAAWVCSEGRMKLLRAIRQAGWHNVIYYDTDSLIVTEEGFRWLWLARMVRENVPGELRFQGRHEQCEIRGIKDYVLDGKHKCSGLPKGEILESQLPHYYWYVQHARGQISDGHKPVVDLILQSYARQEVYQHGIVRADGTVDPIALGEL